MQIIEASHINFPDYVCRSNGTLVGLRYSSVLAGFINSNGYPSVRIKDKCGILKSRTVHRIIAETFLGALPKGLDTDHIDRNKLNNDITNLRYISRSQNNFNKDGNKNNTSGVKGVSWHSQNQLWRAYIMLDYKQISLGTYESFEDACIARFCAEEKYNIKPKAWGCKS